MEYPVTKADRPFGSRQVLSDSSQDSHIVFVAYCSCDVWHLKHVAQNITNILSNDLSTASVYRILSLGAKSDMFPNREIKAGAWIDPIDPGIEPGDILSAIALSITSSNKGEYGNQWSVEIDNMPFAGSDRLYQHQIVATVSDQILEDFRPSRSQVFITNLATAVFDDSRIDSGLIDIGVRAEVRNGHYYSLSGVGHIRWHRHLQKTMWQSMTMEERASMCRGVYWGTYLGPRLLSRFSQNASVDEWFLKTKVRDPSLRPFVADTSCGGRLFALSGTPMTIHERLLVPTSRDEISTTPMTASEVGARLWIRLRRAGLLA